MESTCETSLFKLSFPTPNLLASEQQQPLRKHLSHLRLYSLRAEAPNPPDSPPQVGLTWLRPWFTWGSCDFHVLSLKELDMVQWKPLDTLLGCLSHTSLFRAATRAVEEPNDLGETDFRHHLAFSNRSDQLSRHLASLDHAVACKQSGLVVRKPFCSALRACLGPQTTSSLSPGLAGPEPGRSLDVDHVFQVLLATGFHPTCQPLLAAVHELIRKCSRVNTSEKACQKPLTPGARTKAPLPFTHAIRDPEAEAVLSREVTSDGSVALRPEKPSKISVRAAVCPSRARLGLR